MGVASCHRPRAGVKAPARPVGGRPPPLPTPTAEPTFGWMRRALQLLLLSTVAAAIPAAGLGRRQPGIALACAVALVAAAALPALFRRAGLQWDAGLGLVWLLPFAVGFGLGEGADLYARLSWWDRVGHLAGGAMAFSLMRAWASPRLRARRLAVEAIGVLAALSVGAVWELGEFASDAWLKTATQSGNADSMRDLLFDGLGGLAAWAVVRGRAALPALRSPLLPARQRGA